MSVRLATPCASCGRPVFFASHRLCPASERGEPASTTNESEAVVGLDQYAELCVVRLGVLDGAQHGPVIATEATNDTEIELPSPPDPNGSAEASTDVADTYRAGGGPGECAHGARDRAAA